MNRKMNCVPWKRWGIWLILGAVLASLCGCGGRRVTNETEETTIGIDVAKYQGTIDWNALAQSGIDFAIVRLGNRTLVNGEIREDGNARYNLQEGERCGIALGAYFFSTAVTSAEAEEEARWCGEILKQYSITYPVAYDCEGFRDPDSRQYSMSAEERTDVALAFLETIEDLGYEGMFYGAKNELERFWDMERIQKDYKVWVAQYPAAPYPETARSDYQGEHHMWQYTDQGEMPGITQNVDLNVAYFGYDGIEPAQDDTPREEAKPDVEALVPFAPASGEVTAKETVNLRNMPSSEHSLSQVVGQLNNGDVAKLIGVSDRGWSKLEYNGMVCYAVSSYLTGEDALDPDRIKTQFTAVDEQVTAKEVVNLRALPSVEHEDAEVVGQLRNGEVAHRVGVSDNGWSKLEHNGMTCYAVSSYLTLAGEEPAETLPEQTGIQTQFETVDQWVTAKIEVNLRSLPSVEDPDCQIVASIKNGEVVRRTGINRDVGWSRVTYNGQTLYCVSSYLEEAEEPTE